MKTKLAFDADVSKPADVRRVVDGTLAAFGRIDVLISNAGIWRGSTATDGLDASLKTYDEVVGTNLKGVYMFGRAVIPHMIASGRGGNIINISSAGADNIHGHYGVIKFTLGSGGYQRAFLETNGRIWDSGQGSCH